MLMRQPSRMQESPSVNRIRHTTIVPDKAGTATSVILTNVVESHVNGVGGRIVMWSKEILTIRSERIFHYKVHISLVLGVVTGVDSGNHW